MAARTVRKKKQQQSRVFFGVFFFFLMFTLTWITEKELERVIENKGNNFVRRKTWNIKAAVRK